MPVHILNSSQMMTIGANADAIFVVPNGWMANSKMRIAQVVPTIVLVLIPGCATSIP